MRINRLIFIDEVHNGVREVCHIFGNLEAEVTEWQLLVVDHGVLDLLVKPCDILRISLVVIGSVEHGDGEAKVLQVVVWRLTLIVFLHVFLFAVVVSLEFWLSRFRVLILTIVLIAEAAGIGRHVRQVDIVPLHVVCICDSFTLGGSVDQLAEFTVKKGAQFACRFGYEQIVWEPIHNE